MANRSALMNVMIRAAERAARGLKRDYGEVEQLQVSRKGPADFVSTADQRAERILREELKKVRPSYGIVGEEGEDSPPAAGTTRRWIVDPLDGTTNFLHGLPHFAVSVGLAEENEVVAGVIYDPIKDEIFHAEKGSGAFLNDRRLRVSARVRLADCLIGTGMPFLGRGDHEGFTQELSGVMPAVAGIRRWGAASLDLAYVAAGRLDGFWERSLNAWDIAAGVLLVTEAGGEVMAPDGKPLDLFEGSVVASNGAIHKALMERLSRQKTDVKGE